MASSIGLSDLVLWMVILHFHGNGLAGGRSIAMEEYFQMETYTKFLNRPAIKSIETTNGDIFECVDIYKQPAFDHPRLKNHTIQMRPSTYLGGTKNEVSAVKVQNIEQKNGGCPLGTVPIHRARITDILMKGSIPKFGKNDGDRFLHHYATMELKEVQSIYGTAAGLNVWKPKVQNHSQLSISQIWVTAGPDNELNTIEAGWMADGYKHGCYNLLCKGYVQVSPNVAPGFAIHPISTYNGTQYAIYLSIVKDMKTGNWLLLWGEDQSKLIGYWPKELFNYLEDKAEVVMWGGETYGTNSYPEMGSGHFPEEGAGRACFISKIRVFDYNRIQRNVDPAETLTHYDVPHCYRSIVDRSIDHQTYMYFGGPGGNCVTPSYPN
ncbi:uncharacterized protein LOC122083120 isoform X2 [Macadamia integrifolia]|uniref:uncharacterized protein LOC122083120 isoform X2 n=1 Tax=Macadamia integrifolia TaxID=60698 RepID=UPI001C4E4DB0|nr:uncharacterized protein LOC122083120 isoform X2 [Macadamia integrifolia]